jgi:hypothetical protein
MGDMDLDHVFEVEHRLHGFHSLAASQYRGKWWHIESSAENEYEPAKLEVHLSQVGHGEPRLFVALRTWRRERTNGKWQNRLDYQPERLKLSIDDARELAAMLERVIGLSEMEA